MESCLSWILFLGTMRAVRSLNCIIIPLIMNALRTWSFVDNIVPLKGSWNEHTGINALLTSNEFWDVSEFAASQQRNGAPVWTSLLSGTFLNVVKWAFWKHLPLWPRTKPFSRYFIQLPFDCSFIRRSFGAAHFGNKLVGICYRFVKK